MANTKWGEWIKGPRPDWAAKWACIWGREFRLPADHPYYLAANNGLTYWPGGDKAPDDYDASMRVLFRSGRTLESAVGYRWNHVGSDSDIIGYHPKVPVEEPADTVTIKRMTLEEARDFLRTTPYLSSESLALGALRHLGIICDPQPKTEVERFERETGYMLSPESWKAVEAALAWKGAA